MITFKISLLLLLFSFSSFTLGQVNPNSQVSSKIYNIPNYVYPCTRMLTNNGVAGCTSKAGGNDGAIFLIDSDASLDNLISGPSQPDKIILALDPDYFNKSIIEKVNSKSFEGILVLTDKPQSYAYSPDIAYPNKAFGLYPNSNFTWNTLGDGLSELSFNYPIFAIDTNTSIEIRQYGESNRNGLYPKHGAQLISFMQAIMTSESCLHRGFCAPMGGLSSWATFSPSITSAQPILMVIVPMDTTAFFHDMAIGAQSNTYASVVLTSIMRSLSMVDQSTWNMQVVFAVFNGERWGYLGSTKFVNDIVNFKCSEYYDDTNTTCSSPFNSDLAFMNISLSNIQAILELNQIGNPLTTNAKQQLLFAINQVNPNSPQSTIRSNIMSVSDRLNLSVGCQVATDVPELPPSSSMSFLKVSPNIDHAVITDHFGAYTNNFYNSHQDTSSNVNQQILQDTITLFATVIDQMAGGKNNITVDTTFMNDIFSCLTQSFSCDYVERLLPVYPYDTYPSFYSSVYGTAPTAQLLTIQAQFFHNLFINLTNSVVGDVCSNSKSCPSSDYSCIGSRCRISNTHYHEAVSLAFTFDGSTGNFRVTNTTYPTYTESNWDYTQVKFFLVDSKKSEIIFLIVGIIEFLSTVAILIFSRNYLSKRYKLL
ncbi:nicastrin [Cavenderia fasciculata]|uniref:Nicastrin n=1 Tax=Cavenderia fasciculata TaxID=261658 RepID=F4Q4W1_CACFS|nr:nicastrin [Cavenderia fasciculata]EGG17067.1 nicastrin [Cavenderia fasciculata]|eukprot:XP_004355551.1 nicastrin [Cavenderia fasciculata]